ncbi:hypothetical protein E4L96_23020 [Massilia arenosa]|uniref:DUF3592 domain-containing protein n=1 Tax=Zemynaea arenosa TaxID=2561931 RepID=A0A4Y9RNQ7_9BURK|nr:hypothetical protein [Massilia arenosa]TFW10690.1 hypothetical protein E4L96_23020 [Massilia arenosa]
MTDRTAEPLVEPWTRPAFGWALLAAFLHSAAWSWFVTDWRQAKYDDQVPVRAVLEKAELTRKLGQGLSRTPYLLLTLRPAEPPGAPAQEVMSGGGPDHEMTQYLDRHHPGDMVTAWMYRSSGRIHDVFPREAPDLAGLFLFLLPTLGLATAFLVFFILGVATGTRVSPPRNTSAQRGRL